MARRFAGLALLAFGCLLISSTMAQAADKENKRARKKERERDKKRVMMGDGVATAVDNSEDLKLTPEQKAYLTKLQQSLEKEREKDKEEVEIKKLRDDMRALRKAGKTDEADALKEKMTALMEKQSIKWEERSNAELAKVLPKDIQAKLKEIRGEPEKLPENPFGNP